MLSETFGPEISGLESSGSETTHLPEHFILVCVLCANLTFQDGGLQTSNWSRALTENAESSDLSLGLQQCNKDSFSGFEDYVLDEEDKGEGFVSDSLRRMFETLNFSVLSGTISVFGCVANMINIVVFYRQKFSDSVNISLMGLAISDLGALITLVWMSVCFSPLFRSLSLPFNPVEVQYLTAGWPHVCFARITSYITAYVTLERCLCVTVPLKVKTIITPRRTTITIISIFLALFASVAPVYFGIGLGPVNTTTVTFVPGRTKSNLSNIIWNLMDKNALLTTTIKTTTNDSTNKNNNASDNGDILNVNGTVYMEETVCTLGYVKKVNVTSSTISLVYTYNGAQLENISFSIGVFAQISSFVAVIICTVVLVRTLAQTSRWRAQTVLSSNATTEPGGGATNSATMTQRDKRLLKMITFLSVIFIVCFLPSAVNLIIMICSAEYSIVGRYRNMFQVGWSFLNCLEATNSTVNIFVYYNMSSRYRKCFRELFQLQEKESVYINSNNTERGLDDTRT